MSSIIGRIEGAYPKYFFLSFIRQRTIKEQLLREFSFQHVPGKKRVFVFEQAQPLNLSLNVPSSDLPSPTPKRSQVTSLARLLLTAVGRCMHSFPCNAYHPRDLKLREGTNHVLRLRHLIPQPGSRTTARPGEHAPRHHRVKQVGTWGTSLRIPGVKPPSAPAPGPLATPAPRPGLPPCGVSAAPPGSIHCTPSPHWASPSLSSYEHVLLPQVDCFQDTESMTQIYFASVITHLKSESPGLRPPWDKGSPRCHEGVLLTEALRTTYQK